MMAFFCATLPHGPVTVTTPPSVTILTSAPWATLVFVSRLPIASASCWFATGVASAALATGAAGAFAGSLAEAVAPSRLSAAARNARVRTFTIRSSLTRSVLAVRRRPQRYTPLIARSARRHERNNRQMRDGVRHSAGATATLCATVANEQDRGDLRRK